MSPEEQLRNERYVDTMMDLRSASRVLVTTAVPGDKGGHPSLARTCSPQRSQKDEGETRTHLKKSQNWLYCATRFEETGKLGVQARRGRRRVTLVLVDGIKTAVLTHRHQFGAVARLQFLDR
ncbi:hypothetical protein TNCV_4693231 [Trichonephila clavipes]|nr:hypothetical protein TNCV_4693231 [Trichonephila clavipes]